MRTAREQNVEAPQFMPGTELKMERPLAGAERHGASQRLTLRESTEDELDWQENRRRSREDCERTDRLFFGWCLAAVILLAAIASTLARAS